MTIEIFSGNNAKADLIKFLQSSIGDDWELHLIFKSISNGDPEYLTFSPLFYHYGKYYSDDQTFVVKANLKRFEDDEYSIAHEQVNIFKEIFTKVQMSSVVLAETVLKFDEVVLVRDKNGESDYPGAPENDEWGIKCYQHDNRPGYYRYVVEQDSFGKEYANNCYGCQQNQNAYRELVKQCSQLWETCGCGNSQPYLQSFKDPDEGMNGCYYERCDSCAKRFWDRWYEENDDYDDYDDY